MSYMLDNTLQILPSIFLVKLFRQCCDLRRRFWSVIRTSNLGVTTTSRYLFTFNTSTYQFPTCRTTQTFPAKLGTIYLGSVGPWGFEGNLWSPLVNWGESNSNRDRNTKAGSQESYTHSLYKKQQLVVSLEPSNQKIPMNISTWIYAGGPIAKSGLFSHNRTERCFLRDCTVYLSSAGIKSTAAFWRMTICGSLHASYLI